MVMLVRTLKQLRYMPLQAAIGGAAGVWDRAPYGLATKWLLRRSAHDASHQFPHHHLDERGRDGGG